MKYYEADFYRIVRDAAGNAVDLVKIDEDALGIRVITDAEGNAPPLHSEWAYQQVIDGKPIRLISKAEMIRIPRS